MNNANIILYYVEKKDLPTVVKMLEKWRISDDILYRFGVNLHLEDEPLKSVLKSQQSIKNKLNQVILLWLERRYAVESFGVPTWSQLLCAFKKISEAKSISRELEGLYIIILVLAWYYEHDDTVLLLEIWPFSPPFWMIENSL